MSEVEVGRPEKDGQSKVVVMEAGRGPERVYDMLTVCSV